MLEYFTDRPEGLEAGNILNGIFLVRNLIQSLHALIFSIVSCSPVDLNSVGCHVCSVIREYTLSRLE
jgi:hypothetical protein